MVSGGLLAPDGHYGTLEHLGGDGWVTSPPLVFQNQLRQFNLFHILPEFQKFSRLEHAVQSTTAAASKLTRVLCIRRRNAAVFAKFLRSSAPRAESPTTHTRVDSARPESHPPFKADAGPTTRQRIRTASGCVPKKEKTFHSFASVRWHRNWQTMASIRQQADGWRRNRRFLFRRDLDPQLDRFSFVSN